MVGFGGINPAGRASFHHAYRRLVIDKLDQEKQDGTFASLAKLMRLNGNSQDSTVRQYIKTTLIRKIEIFDPDAVNWHSSATLKILMPNQSHSKYQRSNFRKLFRAIGL